MISALAQRMGAPGLALETGDTTNPRSPRLAAHEAAQ